MIDWLTLRLPIEHVPPATLSVLRSRTGRVTKTDFNGEIEWCISARESIRSDSHQVSVHVGTQWVELSGSPARVLERNNVFGSGDPVVCWSAMVRFVAQEVGPLSLDARHWSVSRVDVTHNYALGSAAEVRQALGYLRHAEGGRLQVRTTSESVYWSPASRMRRAKAYHKGPHLAMQVRKEQAQASPEQVELSDRLLRLELCLGSEWWRRQPRHWSDMSEADYDREHAEFFARVVGKMEVPEMETDLLAKLEGVAKTKGQGRAAYRTWVTVQRLGQENVKSTMARSTWLLHRKILFAAGFTFADLNEGKIVPLRRRVIVLSEPVRSWDELRRAA